jgi:hypothetical protein
VTKDLVQDVLKKVLAIYVLIQNQKQTNFIVFYNFNKVYNYEPNNKIEKNKKPKKMNLQNVSEDQKIIIKDQIQNKALKMEKEKPIVMNPFINNIFSFEKDIFDYKDETQLRSNTVLNSPFEVLDYVNIHHEETVPFDTNNFLNIFENKNDEFLTNMNNTYNEEDSNKSVDDLLSELNDTIEKSKESLEFENLENPQTNIEKNFFWMSREELLSELYKLYHQNTILNNNFVNMAQLVGNKMGVVFSGGNKFANMNELCLDNLGLNHMDVAKLYWDDLIHYMDLDRVN